MIKEDFDSFKDIKQIPKSFTWKNSERYIFYFNNGLAYCKTPKSKVGMFMYQHYTINLIIMNDIIFESHNETVDKCISDYLFWYEINKEKITEIEWYD